MDIDFTATILCYTIGTSQWSPSASPRERSAWSPRAQEQDTPPSSRPRSATRTPLTGSRRARRNKPNGQTYQSFARRIEKERGCPCRATTREGGLRAAAARTGPREGGRAEAERAVNQRYTQEEGGNWGEEETKETNCFVKSRRNIGNFTSNDAQSSVVRVKIP